VPSPVRSFLAAAQGFLRDIKLLPSLENPYQTVRDIMDSDADTAYREFRAIPQKSRVPLQRLRR